MDRSSCRNRDTVDNQLLALHTISVYEGMDAARLQLVEVSDTSKVAAVVEGNTSYSI